MEASFNGITIHSASKQLNTEISTLIKDLIYAISQLSANGLIESIENIFNDTLEINSEVLSNSNIKLNLCHLFGLMYIYQCTIKLVPIHKLYKVKKNIHSDDDRKSNNNFSNRHYDADINILELFESQNRDNKFRISNKILSEIQSFRDKQCILLHYGHLDHLDTENKIEHKTQQQNNETNQHLINGNKQYCNKFHFKHNMMKSRMNHLHKVFKDKPKSLISLAPRKKCNASTSKSCSPLTSSTSSTSSTSLTSPRSQSSKASKSSKSSKSWSNIEQDRDNDKGINYLRMPTKDLGPYHDKNYHSFGRRHNLPKYTMEEISKHNNKESCWIVVDNLVLDVTPFLPYHPASDRCIVKNGGKICDLHFKFHSKKAQKLFWKFVIGRVASDSVDCIIQ